MNIANLNKKNTMMSYKQLSFILTILLLLFTFSFACSPAVNPTDNTVFTPSFHIKVSDGSTDITDSLSIAVDNSNLISITGLSNTVAPNKTYTLTITPLADIFSTDGNDISIEITDPDGFLSGDGLLSSRSFTITNNNDSSYTLEVPFSGAPVEDWLTSDSLSKYIKASFASQEASLTLSENILSVNDLLNDDSGTGSISFALPEGFVANPESITLPDPDGAAIGAATISPSSATFTISETGNTENSQTYTIDTINLAAITAFTPSRHITITDDSITEPTPNDITDTLTIDVNTANLITITGLSNSIGADKAYTLTIAPVTDIFSTSSGADITITITDPDGFSPGDGALSPSDSFSITNDDDSSNSISYTVVVPFSGAEVEEWLTETTFSTYFTGATFEGQTLDSGALSFNFDGDSIAIDGSSIFNLQDGSLQLTTTNIADGYTLTQDLSDPDGSEVAALTDADAGSITITEEGNTANTKTYSVTISLAAYISPVEASQISVTDFDGSSLDSNDIDIQIEQTIITISGLINGTSGSGSVSITQPTTGEFTVDPNPISLSFNDPEKTDVAELRVGTVTITQPATMEFTIDPNPFSLSFTDPDGTNSQDIEVGTVSVTSAGVTALHTIIIRFSTLIIGLKITSDNVENSPLTISSGGTVTLTGLGACELLPQPTFEIDGNRSATVRGFPSYFDRRIDSDASDDLAPYTVNRVLIIEDASGILDDSFTVSIEGFPACDDASLFSGSGDDAANAILIDSAPKLELLSHIFSSDNDNYAYIFYNKFYKLTVDIDLGLAGLPWSEAASGETGEGFPPIGLTDFTFQGTFDCADLSISNLYINKANDNIGLFGITSNNAAIQNCSLINVNVTGNNNVGGLAGGSARITNSYSSGFVSGNDKVGGLAGIVRSSVGITNSYFTGSVTGNEYVGGLVGGSARITNSYSSGFVSGNDKVGGLAGSVYSLSSITNSYATSSVSGTSTVGGLAGIVISGGRITNSYATGSVTGNEDVGGLAGIVRSSGRITNSYATGSVSGEKNVGGLAGIVISGGRITNSYATGFVSGNDKVGGLAGIVRSGGRITNSYATGSVTGNEDVGGLAGIVRSGGRITNSYWDIVTSGRGNSAGGTRKTTTELQSGSAGVNIFTGWSSSIWKFDPTTQYPRLIPVACPNRQYPADPSNVPTDCTAL